MLKPRTLPATKDAMAAVAKREAATMLETNTAMSRKAMAISAYMTTGSTAMYAGRLPGAGGSSGFTSSKNGFSMAVA